MAVIGPYCEISVIVTHLGRNRVVILGCHIYDSLLFSFLSGAAERSISITNSIVFLLLV